MEQGLHGLSVQSDKFGAPIQGFFGLSVQVESNALLEVRALDGRVVAGALTVTISYVLGGTTRVETFPYAATTVYRRSYPEDTSLVVSVTGAAILPYAATFSVPLGGFLTMAVRVQRRTGGQIIRRR